ncbi:MAG: hypothetical protein AAF609_19980 [Cyanobacteria bacterium P01_C01_bin.120]
MIQVKNEQQVLHEGLQILLANMEPSAFARFWAACNLGKGGYLQLKDKLFAEESVASLYSKILDFQDSKTDNAESVRTD